MKTLLPAVAFLGMMFSCSSNEIGNSKDVNPDAIYTSYNISYSEGDESVNVMCQFRFAGKNGTTLVLASPAGVTLDGNALRADSGNITGAYYGTYKPLTGFAGKHEIVYTDVTGIPHREAFAFKPFKLVSTIPQETTAADMPLQFEGLDDGDLIHLEVADTAFETTDINDVDTIRNGQVTIPAAKLAALKKGPLDISIYRDEDVPLQNPTKEGGVLNIIYKLRFMKTVLK